MQLLTAGIRPWLRCAPCKASVVWREMFRGWPSSARPALESLVGGGTFAPWVRQDPATGKFLSRHLVWEPCGSPRRVGVEAVEDIPPLVSAWAMGRHEEFERKLVEFYTARGPLFGEKLNPVPMFVASREMWPLAWIIAAVASVRDSQKGDFSKLARLLRLADLVAKVYPEADAFSPGAYSLPLVPAKRDSWFRIPKRPEFVTEGQAVDWVRKKVVVPSLDRLIRRRSTVSLSFSKEGQPKLQVIALDLYALAVLSLLGLSVEVPTCECGCGKPLPPGRRKWFDESHARKVRGHPVYDDALAKFRMMKRRGVITAAQYDEVKDLVKQLYWQGVMDKGELVDAALDLLGMGYPEAL